MRELEILVIDQHVVEADYIKNIIKQLLPRCEVTISLTAARHKDRDFDLIILDTKEALANIEYSQLQNVIIYSLDSGFVIDSINLGREVILRSTDFYEKVKIILIKKGLL